MNDLILWYAGLGLGSIFFVLGLIVFILERKKHDLALAKMSLFEIVAAFFLIFPVEYFDSSFRSPVFLLKTITLTLLDILNIFSADGFHVLTIEGHPALTDVYVLVLSLVNLSIMISLIGFVLQFLTGVIAHLLFRLRRYKTVYLFSEMNAKTVSIARSIRKKHPSTGSPYAIIFLDKQVSDENRETARALEAIYSVADFSKELTLILKKTPELELFLFGSSEEDNLVRLNEFTKLDFTEKSARTKLYVEQTEIPWDVYDDLMKESGFPQKKVIVNLVDSDENFVLNDLYEYSVFQGSRESGEGEGKDRIVDALVIGSGRRAFEMVRALLPLCQMPGYELKLTVIDEGTHGAALRRRIPELKDRMNEVGESIYTFTYLENCDFDSEEFEQMVRDHCPKYTFAFVATDRNVTNIDLGLRLNVLRGRLNNGSDYHIRICTDHTELSENWSPKLRDRIKLVGGIREVYDYEFITMSRIETAAKQLHLIRQADKQNDGQGGEAQEPVAWEEYCNDEYKRRSVFARALAIKYKIEVIRRMGLSTEVTCSDDLWICYEHMRWNMYTRSLGYVCTGNTGLASDPPGPEDRKYSKVHECLVPYDQLSQDNKNKDKIKLTREVLEIYEGHHTD